MEKGWFDNFSSKAIDRNIDTDGIVSYSIVNTPKNIKDNVTENINLLEVYFMTLKSSKKTLTPELKRVIDDFVESDINTVWGQTEYTEKTPLGHAIDEINVETVDYLIQKGADVNISGTNQKHILQELLSSNATDKRVQILETVVKNMETNVIPLTKGFDGQFYSMKYLIPLVNSNQLSDENVEYLMSEVKPSQLKVMTENCKRVILVEEERVYRESLPDNVKDIFLI